jgi:hypothetical protein
MRFGLLNFFGTCRGNKSEQGVVKKQLDCMKAAEDMGFDSIWPLNVLWSTFCAN